MPTTLTIRAVWDGDNPNLDLEYVADRGDALAALLLDHDFGAPDRAFYRVEADGGEHTESINFLASVAAYDRRNTFHDHEALAMAVAGGISAHFEDPDYEEAERLHEELENERREKATRSIADELFGAYTGGEEGTWDMCDGDQLQGIVVHNDPERRYFVMEVIPWGGAVGDPSFKFRVVEYGDVDLSEEVEARDHAAAEDTAPRYEFESTDERDAWINTNFPDRKPSRHVPGFYSLPDGRSLGVFCNTVTVYPPEEG